MLDEFGKIAVAEIVFYVPVLFISLFVTIRCGFSRREGWLALHIFSTVRIVAAILSIVSKTESKPSVGLITASGILQSLGLSPLLLATYGCIMNIADYGRPDLIRILHMLRFVIIAGVTLAIIGGTKLTPGSTPSNQASGHSFSKAGAICFIVVYGILFGIHALLWEAAMEIPLIYRKLLRSVSFSFPFLAVRVLYSALGAFVRNSSEWSPLTGDWRIYLVMGLIMEYIVVCIYIITAAVVSLHKAERGEYLPPSINSEEELVQRQKVYNAPTYR